MIDSPRQLLYSLSIDYDRAWVCQAINMTGYCIYSGHQQLLNDDDDMIIIETIMIDKEIFRKYLGRTPPLVHWLVDGKYNSVLDKVTPL